MTNSLSKLIHLLEVAVEYLALSVLMATAVILMSNGKRRAVKYFLASLISGAVAGTVADMTPFLADFSHLIAIAGTITGPATLAAVQHKTIFDVYKEVTKKDEDKNAP